MDIKQIKIQDIHPYEKNAKKHSKKQVHQVANSIKEFGFNQPIVIDKENVIIVGHGRYQAAVFLGMTKVPVLQIDISEEKAKAYRLADNKLNESEWEMELVITELKGLSTTMLDLTGFDKDLILDTEPKDDMIPEKVKASTKLGDVYALGDHRLICGDSTDEKVFEKLMDGVKAEMTFTDPPYNVDYQGGGSYANHKSGAKKREGIKNDKMTKESFYEFLFAVNKNILAFTGGGYIYLHEFKRTRFAQEIIRNGRRTLAVFYRVGKKQFYSKQSRLSEYIRTYSLRLARYTQKSFFLGT